MSFNNREITLESMEKLFEELLVQYWGFDFSKIVPDTIKQSHHKYKFFEHQLPNGKLIFESILFLEGEKTGPHTHPRFLVDEIISGEIQEERFKKVNDIYRPWKTDIRQAGEKRSVCCPELFPHDVMAVNGPCQVFCLSFGPEEVEGIEIG